MEAKQDIPQEQDRAVGKPAVSGVVCPYDDFACRVYGWCRSNVETATGVGTERCEKRREHLGQTCR
jgi:hypothetical protein